jgi:hypothetical protein
MDCSAPVCAAMTDKLDEIIDGIMMKMAVEPTYFPLAPGLQHVRRARSKQNPTRDSILPNLVHVRFGAGLPARP